MIFAVFDVSLTTCRRYVCINGSFFTFLFAVFKIYPYGKISPMANDKVSLLGAK